MSTEVGTVIAFAFWACVATILYVYAGYPLTLLAWRGLPRTEFLRAGPLHVTVVVAAYNEVRHIAATVSNKLAQRFPDGQLDVIIVSDGSTDGTDRAVEQIGDPRVRLIRQEPRQGKSAALNAGIAAARTEIIVISDANSCFEPDAIARLAACFADPLVGYATGRLDYEDPGETAVGGGSGLYMRYEGWLRELETRVGSVVGVNGGVDAFRRSLYTPLRPDHLPDFVLPLRVVGRGFRVVYCPEAVAREQALGQQREEFSMRVRVSLRALNTLAEMRDLLHPRNGRFAFQLLVHKVLRYLLVVPMLGALIASGLLWRDPLYRFLFAVQLGAYGLAAVGWAAGGRIRLRLVFVPFYFCLLNLAATVALLRFLRGEKQVIWTPRKGA